MSEKTFKIVNGDLSDGYHTFDELYEHRCLLFINLCLILSHRCYWRPHYEGWPLLGLETDRGQVTYHVPEKYLPLFTKHIRQGGPEWDGHTSKDAADRLESFAKTFVTGQVTPPKSTKCPMHGKEECACG